MNKPLLKSLNQKQSPEAERPVTVLVVGQVPPPVNGQSLMIRAFLEGEYASLRLVHVPLQFSRSTAEIGSFAFRKLFVLCSTLIHILVVRLRSGATILYYPPAGANIAPVLRDLVLLISTRGLFKQTVFHFHAAGLVKIVPRLPKVLRPLFSLAYNHPDLAIFTTAATSAQAEHLQAKNVAIIPCGIPDDSTLGVRLASNEVTIPSILFVGILCEEKGVLVLLEACRLLETAGVRFSVTCVGAFQSAMFEEKVRSILRDTGLEHMVTLPGVVTGKQKADVFANADIFCFPSYYPAESFGVVLIEAMSFSLPIVATSWQGIPEVLGRCEDGSNPPGALLVGIQDPAALAKALETLLQSAFKREAMGKHNRARYLELFTLDAYRQSLERELVQLARTKESVAISRKPISSVHTVFNKLRSRWVLATTSFLLVTAASFTCFSLAHRLLPISNVTPDSIELHQQDQGGGASRAQVVSAHPPISPSGILDQTDNAISPDRVTEHAQQMRQDAGRRKLLQQFEADTHRRDKLEEYRTRLSSPSGRSHSVVLPEEGAPGLSTVHDLRTELATALIRLLTLEKHETDDNPDVIYIRKHISSLQMRIVQAAATTQPARKRSPERPSSHETQLSQINTQILLYDNKITSDLQQLTQLSPPAVQSSTTATPLFSTSGTQHSSLVAFDNTTAQRNSTSPSLSPGKIPTIHGTNGQSITMSILLGILFSISFVLVADRYDRVIRDESALRDILPETAEYIGSIPTMKKS